MSSRAKSVGRASLAALLTLGLTAVPVLAEKGGGKPDWAGHKPDGKHGGPDRAGNGSPARSPDLGPAGGARGVGAGSVLAAGATAAMVSALLGGQARAWLSAPGRCRRASPSRPFLSRSWILASHWVAQ